MHHWPSLVKPFTIRQTRADQSLSLGEPDVEEEWRELCEAMESFWQRFLPAFYPNDPSGPYLVSLQSKKDLSAAVLNALQENGPSGSPEPISAEAMKLIQEEWRQLRRVGMFAPDKKLYPTYDDYLQKSMVEEATSYFHEVLAENLSLREFLDSGFQIVKRRSLVFVPGSFRHGRPAPSSCCCSDANLRSRPALRAGPASAAPARAGWSVNKISASGPPLKAERAAGVPRGAAPRSGRNRPERARAGGEPGTALAQRFVPLDSMRFSVRFTFTGRASAGRLGLRGRDRRQKPRTLPRLENRARFRCKAPIPRARDTLSMVRSIPLRSSQPHRATTTPRQLALQAGSPAVSVAAPSAGPGGSPRRH